MDIEETSDLVLYDSGSETNGEVIDFDSNAPYGRKADGTPRKRPGRPKGSTNSGTGNTTPRARGKDRLELEIKEALQEDLAPTIGALSPLTAWVIDDRCERTARALASIANRSPGFKKGLEKALVYKDFVTLVSLPPAIAVAIAVDTGVIRYDSMMSRRFHLYEPFIYMYGDQGSETMPDFVPSNPIGLLGDMGNSG